MSAISSAPTRCAVLSALVGANVFGLVLFASAAATSPRNRSEPVADETRPQRTVDAYYSAFGDNHSRAVHAKGVMVQGTFEPSPDAAALSKASLFQGHNIPVLARFSNFTGIPTIPDNIGDANPRGLALKFNLPAGATADIVSHSFNGFPTATAEEFHELLLAIGASHSDPAAMDHFLRSHPIAKTFLTTQKPAPESYATLSYFGVNSFAFTDAKGKQTIVRYRFIPAAAEVFVRPEQLGTKDADYLQSELPNRLAKGPIAFTWYAQIADPSDAVADPSIAWPESRGLVKLGEIQLSRMVASTVESDKATKFAPLNVPAGIEGADPMLQIREEAYPLSFQHRQ